MKETDALRSFNRFYTRVLGLFDPRLLGSGQTLLEARVLYEIWRGDGPSSADLARLLGVDRGQLSRVVSRLAGQGLLRKPERHAGRRGIPLALTPEGLRVMRELDALSSRQAAGLLAPLDAEGRGRLVRALDAIRGLLSPASPDADGGTHRQGASAAPGVDILDARPGDLGRVVQRHAELYAASHGLSADFEGYVLLGMADWLRGRGSRSRMWVAARGDEFLGSVAVVEAGEDMAQLRWLLVEPGARGQGLGRRLVERAVEFARGEGYAGILLWTVDFLGPALALYRSMGFRRVESRPGVMGGKPCMEERWELAFSR